MTISIYYPHICCGSGRNLETTWLASYDSEFLLRLQWRYWPGLQSPEGLIGVGRCTSKMDHVDLFPGLLECSQCVAAGFLQEKEQCVKCNVFHDWASGITSLLCFFCILMDTEASNGSVLEATLQWCEHQEVRIIASHLGYYTYTFKFLHYIKINYIK